jgi:hypothetical protein
MEVKTSHILVDYGIDFLWPVCNNVLMFNEGTINRLVHIISLFMFSPCICNYGKWKLYMS